MANNFFGSDSSDMALENIRGYIDNTGLLRVKTPNISSYNFDGSVPNVLDNITASAITPGMKVSFTGSTDANIYYNVLSILNEDDFITGSALATTYIEYLDENSEIQSVVYGASSTLPVLYEDWNQKYLGTNGWYLSNQGNAIFSNVAVRGRIEATEGTLDNIVATSGKIEDLIIGGNYYEIINIIGVDVPSSSAISDPGQFILTTNSAQKRFYPGDNGRFQGVTASGTVYQYGFPVDATNFFTILDDFRVLTASYNEQISLGVEGHRYHCIVSQSGLISNYDLGGVSASSGSFTFGQMEFGEIQTYSISNQDIIEGFIFKTVGAGSFWSSYIPDYIDLSGRFRLGGGRLTFDGQTLNVGIGNSPTFAGLTVNGSTFIPDAYTATVSNRVVNVDATGRLGNPSSSHTIKKNIVPLSIPDELFGQIVPENKITNEDVSSYRNILNLTPVKFEWDIPDQTPDPEFGLIAEEVIEKMPESSLPGDESVPGYYKITSLFASLLAVVKDQQKTIEDLENRVLQLESQLGG